MRILSLFGTRPEAIKMAPVIHAARSAQINVNVCVTAQHRGMLDQMLEVFAIEPDFDLNLMQENQSPMALAARVLDTLPPIVTAARPDWLLVQGDTTTAFAAALVGYHERIPVAHIEAGLRTDDKWQPFPEEMNRRLIASLADLHFAPTQRAADNLCAEGAPRNRIFVTGNTVVDALKIVLNRPVEFTDARLKSLTGRVLLVTAHRRENFGSRLEQICLAVLDLLARFSDLTIVFPVHPNPSVTLTVQRILGKESRVLLIEPQPYPIFVHLMKRAALLLSDSGGVQEEAATVGTRVLVMREVTERPEAIESGWAQLVGVSREKIVEQAGAWLDGVATDRPPLGENPFGDGDASIKIVRVLQQLR